MWMIRSCISGEVFKRNTPLGRAFLHPNFPTSVRLYWGLPPWQSLGKQGLETRTSGHSFLSLLLKYTHSQQAFVAIESVLGSPFVSLRTLGSGKTKGHTSVSVKCLLSLQLTHSLCKALNGASSQEWGSYHTYFNTALLLSSLVINGQRKCFAHQLWEHLADSTAELCTCPPSNSSICISWTALNYMNISLVITSFSVN